MRKRILVRLSLALVVIFTFCSCRTDDFSNYTNNPDDQFQNRKFSVLTRKQVENIGGLIEKVQNVENNMIKENGADSFLKINQDSLLQGTLIKKDSVLLIESNGNETYTFKISRSSGSYAVENLVLRKNADGSFTGVLMKYDLTKSEREIIGLGHSLDLTNKVQVFPIENLDMQARIVSQTSGCYTVTWETGICASGQHSYGQPCDLVGEDRAGVSQIISVSNKCTGAAVSDISVDTDDNPNAGGGLDTGVWGVGGDGELLNNTPCSIIKQQNNGVYKDKIKYLKTKTGDAREYGFRVSKATTVLGVQYQELSNAVGTNTIEFKFFNTTYGAIHTHFETLVPVFSPDDVNSFIGLLKNAYNNNIPLEEVFLTLVNPDGTVYQLRGDGIDVANLEIFSDTAIDILNSTYKNDTKYNLTKANQSSEYYQAQFLKFMRDYMNIPGAKFYSIDSDDKATEIYLSGNTRKRNECP